MEIIQIFLNSICGHMKAYLGTALFLSFGTAEVSEAFGLFSLILFLSFFSFKYFFRSFSSHLVSFQEV